MKPRSILSGFCLLALLLLAGGCATTPLNYRPVGQWIVRPAPGTTATVRRGEPLLLQDAEIQQEAIRLTHRIDYGMITQFTLLPGYYVKVGADATGTYYCPADGPNGGEVRAGPWAGAYESIHLSTSGRWISIVTADHFKLIETAAGIEQTLYRQPMENVPQQTLVYAGAADKIVTLTYREVAHDADAEPLEEDFSYDLRQSPIVECHGARLIVLEASPDQIRYRVIAGFDRG